MSITRRRLASGAWQLLYVAKLLDLDAKECALTCICVAGAGAS
jgi:hypothetical protein